MRYAAEPATFKSSFVPAFDPYTGIGPNPGDIWVDMTIPVVKRMVSKDPDVWVSIEGAGGGGGPTFNDDETPTGLINSANVTYTLANTPSPVSSLQLYRNGVLQRRTVDYTISGLTITMTTAPQTGDSLKAWYRR